MFIRDGVKCSRGGCRLKRFSCWVSLW